MTPNQLPPLPEIDPVLGHPEHHMKWTPTEIKWIQKYATDYALAALAQHAQEPVADERKAFESCTLMEGSLFKRRADDPDKYWDGNVQDDWELWQARAALQSPAPQAGGWLPIESAPKDGTRLILWWGGKPVFAGWLDNSQCKHPWAGWQTPSLTPRPQGEPTHYMPPPPAPQTKGQP